MIKRLLRLENDEFSSVIRNGIYIIIISTVVGFIVNLVNPRGFIFISKTEEKNNNIVIISGEEAKIKSDSGSAIFIDARQYDEFRISHIPDAINIPAIPDSLSEKKIEENTGIISASKELVIYCDGIACGASDNLAKSILKKGYSRHIYIIKNGIPEWEEKGYPLEKYN